MLVGFIYARQGYRNFFDRKLFIQRDDIIVPVLAILLVSFFTCWKNRIDIRTSVIAISVFWMSIRITQELSIGIPAEMKTGAWFGAFFFGLTGVIFLFRGITATTQPDQIEFFIPSWTNVSVYSFAIFLAAASTFTSIMLTGARPEMELKSTQEQMKLLANTDSLTGLYNRRYFTESAQRDFIRARRFNHSASVLFADLDHFKDINDTYGHSVGDAILIRTANIIHANVRQVDLSARLASEEFILLLIQSTENTILNAAERIKKAIEEDNFELDGHQINYTIIIGVAALCPDDISIQELIDRADASLYPSRENGRNQVQMG